MAKQVFFPNLNGLRFVAASLVMICHIEQWKGLNGLHRSLLPFFDKIGSLGVTLFFVLSGFLITYLLLTEKQDKGTINVKKFYLRRVFRIWPLYYLIIIIGLFVLSGLAFFSQPGMPKFLEDHYPLQILLFFLILPNVSHVAFPLVPYVLQTWSIGVEEQFYIMWPLIIKHCKNYIEIMVFIISFLVLLRTGFLTDFIYYANKIFHFAKPDSRALFVFTRQLDWFFYYFRIGCMAIGGIGAYLLFYKKEQILSIIYKRSSQIFAYIFVVYMCAKALDLCHEFYAFFFVLIILNLASNKQSILNLENPVFDYLGRISYGLYMYHMMALTIALKTVQVFDVTVSGLASNVVYYLLSFAYTIAIASISYYLFESQFLKLKKVFASV